MPSDVANSSLISASLGALTSCTVTSKTLGLPASSALPYSSGNDTSTSFVSPALVPTSWSSKPGINCPDPSSNSKPSAVPPSKASPSIRPTKSILTRSPSRALAVLPRGSKSLRDEARRSSASSTFSSSTSTTGRVSFTVEKSIKSMAGITSKTMS